jgi:hypothetical protein
MFGTTLVDEYRLLAAQGFGWDELWAMNRGALDAAFLDDAERRVHAARYDAWAAAEWGDGTGGGGAAGPGSSGA